MIKKNKWQTFIWNLKCINIFIISYENNKKSIKNTQI